MNNNEFKKIVDNRLETCKATLGTKAIEYATDSNRLHNFEEAAHLRKTTKSDACLWFALKHIISVVDMVESVSSNGSVTKEYVAEKIGDTINYMLLLESCISQEMEDKGIWKPIN